jgi:hypothetical protein
MIVNIIIKTLIPVILISSFIGIFFFTYAAKIEENIVKKQCSQIIEDLSDDIKTMVPSNMLEILYNQIIPKLQAPDLSKEDTDVKQKNDILLKKVTKLISIFIVGGLAIVIALVWFFKIPVKEILIHSSVSLLFVAIVEYSFLTFFAQNYRTIDSNFVKMQIIQTLIKNSN